MAAGQVDRCGGGSSHAVCYGHHDPPLSLAANRVVSRQMLLPQEYLIQDICPHPPVEYNNYNYNNKFPSAVQ